MGKTRNLSPSPKDLERASSHEQREAKRLLQEAGAPELAKQSGDSSSSQPAKPTPQNDVFAKRWGFASYLSMFETSKPVAEIEGKDWLVTNVGPEQWIVWNDEDLHASQTYRSFDEAAQHAGEAAGPAETPSAPSPTG